MFASQQFLLQPRFQSKAWLLAFCADWYWPVVLKLTLIVVAVVVAVFCRDRIYALQRQKENLEKQVDLANKALAESVAKPKK